MLEHASHSLSAIAKLLVVAWVEIPADLLRLPTQSDVPAVALDS